MSEPDQQHGTAGSDPPGLRLGVLDIEDLAVVSTHLQGADVTVADMAFLPKAKRFVLVVDRFDWLMAAGGRLERCRAGIHFERVLAVAHLGLDLADAAARHHLLAISFKPEQAPSGQVLLAFAGGSAIRLTVECLEAEMRDLGPRWAVEARPDPRLDDIAIGTL